MVRDKMSTLVMNFLATLGTEVGVVWYVFTNAYKVLLVNRAAVDTAICRMPDEEDHREPDRRFDLLPKSWCWVAKFFIVSSLALLSWVAVLLWFLMVVV